MKSKIQALVLLSISLCAALAFAPSAFAQTHRCSVLGTVHDPVSAAIPDAEVKLTYAGTSETRAPEQWFDTSACSFPAPGTFGNAGRNILTGPGHQSVNASLAEHTALGERVRLLLRVEVFNLFNHPDLNLPDNFLGSPTFGRVTPARDPRHIQFGAKLMV